MTTLNKSHSPTTELPRSAADEAAHRRRTRLYPVIGVMTVLAGLGVYQTGKVAFEHVKQVAHDMKEYRDFTDPKIGQELEEKGYTPDSVISYTLKATDTKGPNQLAIDLGATDIYTVADEISAQVGGPKSMNPGEIVYIPVDQLKTSPTS